MSVRKAARSQLHMASRGLRTESWYSPLSRIIQFLTEWAVTAEEDEIYIGSDHDDKENAADMEHDLSNSEIDNSRKLKRKI